MASKASNKVFMEADMFQVLTIRYHRDQIVENLTVHFITSELLYSISTKINAVMKSTIEGLKAEIMDQINVDVDQQVWYLQRQLMVNSHHLRDYIPYDCNYTDDNPLSIDVYQASQ